MMTPFGEQVPPAEVKPWEVLWPRPGRVESDVARLFRREGKRARDFLAREHGQRKIQ